MPIAFVNVAASQTDSVVIAAVHAGVSIRVIGVMCMAGATATDLTFNSKGSGAGTAVSCKFANGANGGACLPVAVPGVPEYNNNAGWIQTNAGEALTVTTGAGSATGIQVVWEPFPLTWKT